MRLRVAPCAALALAIWGCDSSNPVAPTPPPTACAFQVTAPAQNFGPDGGTTSVTVSTTAQCSWSARTDTSWISIVSGASGTGPGTVGLSVASNPALETREGVVTVAERSLRMSQQGREAAPCTYALRSGAGRFGPEGGSAVATVTTEARCSWSATTTDDWLTVDPTEGTGTASITFRAAPYTGATERKANIQVADQTWTVRQDPPSAAECTYSVTPAEIVLHWHHTGGEVRVSTRAGCSWTVSTGEAWLNVSGPTAREGDGGVQFTTGIYTVDGTRRAPIEVRWPTATAGQNVWVVHEGCRYGMDESTRTFTAAGGQAQVMVVTQPVSSSCMQGCPWTAVSDSSWIRILSGSPGVGDNPFSYEVLPNTTGVSRTGAITVMGHRVPIVQTP